MEGQRGSVLVVDDEPTIAEVVSPLPPAGRLRRPASPATAARARRSRARSAPTWSCSTSCCPASTGSRSCAACARRTGPHRGDPADRQGRGVRPRRRPAPRRRRLRGQAVLARRARRPRRCGAAPDRHVARRRGAARLRRPAHRAGGPAGLVDGEEVELTLREFDLLLYLAQHPGVFPRPAHGAVWQYSFYSDTSTVTVHIRRLRAKIEPDASRSPLDPDRVGRRLSVLAVRRPLVLASRRQRAAA